MKEHPALSVVVPVFREEKNVPELLRRLIPILETCAPEHEVIFAMDPSPDRTEAVILEARARNPRIKLLTFSRRFGQPMAVLAGLEYSRGAAAVVMDADLQDPPEVIPDLLAKWREGFDVVLARRESRDGEAWLKRSLSKCYYRLINMVSDFPIPRDTGEFRLMSRRVVDEVNRLPENHGFLRGLVAVVGFRQAEVMFDRSARFAGTGNYNGLGSWKVGLNGLICFSSRLLRLSSFAGFVIAGGSLAFGVLYAILKFSGHSFPTGNPTIVILVLFMGGVQLISVGILGEYVGRIYEEVKGRPKFIVDKAVGFEGEKPAR